MPNKTRRRARRPNRASVQQLTQKLQQVSVRPKRKKATPFADAGAITGQRLGSMFGMPMLKGVGRWLGSGIGTILGSGDYSVVGAAPAYNVLSNGNQIPKFASTKQTNIVCHREYLGDIFGTAGFNNTSYPLNPGMAVTFPWLSSIAQNYQQYKFHGIIFEFRPLITDFVTNGAPGVVIMATNYNADVPIYTTKQEMENSEYAVSVKPTRDLMHGVECATTQTVLSELYIRSGDVTSGQDLRLYDLGNFQFATQANPVQDLGELWVSYCVEFFKPVLPADVGGNVLSAGTNRTGATLASPFGTVVSGAFGTLDLTATSDTLTWTAQPGNHYLVVIAWGSGSFNFATITTSVTGLAATNSVGQLSPEPGAISSNNHTQTGTYRCTLLNPGIVSYKVTITGGVPPLVRILVTEISSTID
jgi:hypothetical protein